MKMNQKAQSKTSSNAGVLFVMGEREINSTSARLLNYPAYLGQMGYHVDVLTHDMALKDKLQKHYSKDENVTVLVLQQEDRFWTMRQRDNFARTFIKLYHDVIVPGTDMKLWKMAALDDFLWHVSRCVQEPIQGEYKAVFMTIPSGYERPVEATDVFYTSAVYYCKQQGVPLVGVQIYPISDIPANYLDVPDYWLVDNPGKARPFMDGGRGKKRVFTVDGLKDRYCMSTVEDPFLTTLLNDELKIARDSLAITIVNHPSNRLQIKDIIEVTGKFSAKKTVFFVFVGMSVRELTEKSVFEDITRPLLEKDVKNFYLVESDGIIRALMLSDVIISTSYIIPLSFASRYGKTGVIYNPLRQASPYIDDVEYAMDKDRLVEVLGEARKRKQSQTHLVDVMKGIIA